MSDRNHEEKNRTMGYMIYEGVNKTAKSTAARSRGSRASGGTLWGCAALLYLGAFMSGTFGVGVVSGALGLVSVLVVIVWLCGGLG